MVVVNKAECVGCEECLYICPVTAIVIKLDKAEINHETCNQCERCIPICPVKAIRTVTPQS